MNSSIVPGIKWEIKEGEKICSFDIDGVLNYYPDSWIEWVNNRLHTNFDDLNVIKRTLSYEEYRRLKHEYRNSEEKLKLKVREGAKELTTRLHCAGYTQIMLTSRPIHLYPSLLYITTEWLRRNGIIFDGLIYGEDKHVKVLKLIPHLRFHVEDHRYYANLIAKWGYRVYLLNNRYNQGEIMPNVIRINDLMEVLEYESIR